MSYIEKIAASTLLPMDTVSVALTSVPKSLPVLSGIFKLSTDIRETTQRVETNKEQCKQLSERIDTLIGFLAQSDLSNSLNEAMHIALRRFEAFLRRCLEFISTFLEASWFKRIINNRDYERKFQDLNRELTQYSNDLNFGIGLNNMQTNKNFDGNHRTDAKSEEFERFEEDIKQQKMSEMADSDYYSEITDQETTFVPKGMTRMSTARPTANSQTAQENIFVSGSWNYQYKQYNQYYGPFPHQLHFNSRDKTLQGYGEDNVGQYVLGGTFSETTGQIEMTQSYQIGTGDPTLNLGHQDLIQLHWNSSRKIFEGLAYSQVQSGYIAGALVEMWFP